MEELQITELPNGIQATFADGHQATLTLDGASCTCNRKSGVPCAHIRVLVPIYNRRKWALAESMAGSWGPSIYRRIGIDPQIFFPPAIDWAGEFADADFVYIRNVQRGYLFLFRDGAHLWVGQAHPDGRTKCSLCGTRDCRHYEMILDEVFSLMGEKRQEVA